MFGLTAFVFSSFFSLSQDRLTHFFFTYSAILIRVATIGYAREPDFEVHSSEELSVEERIAWALLNRNVFRDACENEGINLRSAEKIVKRFEKRLAEKEAKRRIRVKSKL